MKLKISKAFLSGLKIGERIRHPNPYYDETKYADTVTSSWENTGKYLRNAMSIVDQELLNSKKKN